MVAEVAADRSRVGLVESVVTELAERSLQALVTGSCTRADERTTFLVSCTLRPKPVS